MTSATVLPCEDLPESLDFFSAHGFRIEQIWPADGPRVAIMSGHGLRIRLDRDHTGHPPTLRLSATTPDGDTVVAPNGTVLLYGSDQPTGDLAPLEQRLHIAPADGAWHAGRAGMRYRDLIPDREGGRFIASHIHIADGGPVPDYVHFHNVRFQLIFVRSGWVKVVYEDQGDPFVMEPGDCVIQPPQIRHRVLESSPNLEVVEIGCPAVHMTSVDHDLELPNGNGAADRRWAGQRFVRYQGATAKWEPWRGSGFERSDTGVGQATDGLADVGVLRPAPNAAPQMLRTDHEFMFMFVLEGSVELGLDTGTVQVHQLASGAAVAIPASVAYGLSSADDRTKILEVTLPAGL